MLIELIVLVIAIVGLLSLVGLGVTIFLAPDLGGIQILLCPFVGLAILYWACQVLSPWSPSSWIVLGTCVVGGLLSILALWTARHGWRSRLGRLRTDLLIVLPLGLLSAIVLQLPMIHRGIFTLANFSGDDIFTWAPTADYMQHHAYFGGHTLAYTSPLLWLLPTNIYPGSAGTVDGGLAAILGLRPYQFVEPLTAVCLAMGALGVYLLIRIGLRLPCWVSLCGGALAATSQSRFITAGFGYAQSARGAAVMIGALVLFVVAVRDRSVKAAIMAGAMAAVLSAIYMPLFLVLLAAIAGGLVVYVASAIIRGEFRSSWGPLLALLTSGLVAGAQNVLWLLADGGLHDWSLQRSYGTSVYFVKYPFPYLVGSAPFVYLYRAATIQPFSLTRPLFWNGAWTAASFWVAAMAVLLVLAGMIMLIPIRRKLEFACLITPVAYGAGVFVLNDGGFGSFQTVIYLAPIGCAFASVGLYGFSRLTRRGEALGTTSIRSRLRGVNVRSLILVMIFFVVIAFQISATAETESFFIQQPGTLPKESLSLQALDKIIAKGSSVLMYSADGSNGAATVRKTDVLVAAAMFLTNRNITIEGRYFFSTYESADEQTIRAMMASNYDYILHYEDPSIAEPDVPPDYRLVWRSDVNHLVLYRRD